MINSVAEKLRYAKGPVSAVGDRIQINSVLIVLCFVSVLMLESQSAASYSTYLLSISMLLTLGAWDDVFRQPLLQGISVLLGWLVLSSLWSTPFEIRAAAARRKALPRCVTTPSSA
jgi:hypothetical protein